MTGALRNFPRSTSSSCSISAKCRPLVDINDAYEKIVYIGPLIMFRVRNRRFENLLQDRRGLRSGEGQGLDRPFHRQSPKLIGNKPSLLRGETGVSKCCRNLHQRYSTNLLLGLSVGSMTTERTSRSEFAELMSHHVLGHKYRNVLPPIMDGDRESNHFRHHHRPSGPCTNGPSAIDRTRRLDLVKQVIVHKRPFLDRTWHRNSSPYLRRFRLRKIIVEVLLFLRVLCPLVGTPHGVTGCRPPEERPSPPPWG